MYFTQGVFHLLCPYPRITSASLLAVSSFATIALPHFSNCREALARQA
jgi:hypothetical protein